MPKRKELPPYEDDPEQMCPVCTFIGQMRTTHHEAGCFGKQQCGNTAWALLQQPHINRECPRCSVTWAEGIPS